MNESYVPNKKAYFSPLIRELQTRGTRSALGLLSLSSEPLRNHLRTMMMGKGDEQGAILADPVFEPTFGWTESDGPMSSIPGPIVHPELIKCMSHPPKALAKEPNDYTFPVSRFPFAHQLEAWELLSQKLPQSVVVTSGTGSGKTECFLVPILSRLSYQADKEGVLEGVRALFIYPLNALINSQKNRLDAWTDGFKGKIRYCMYTGALEQEAKASTREYSGQVLDRSELRRSAPPILVTNATMLEYMLVRQDDAPILEQSQGKLEWIVLDEAHTYAGSQAAEMALLLRRVMLAFGVKPENVRFVATSATFGHDQETTESLKKFLSEMGGIRPDQVHIVYGKRHIPLLPPIAPESSKSNQLDGIATIERDQEISATRFRLLSGSLLARRIRSSFIDGEVTKIRKLSELCAEIDPALTSKQMLQWLDLLTGTKDEQGQAFLPLRVHLFHNVIPSLLACVDKDCKAKSATRLDNPAWRYGAVYLDERLECDCGAPALPLYSCRECNENFLIGRKTSDYRLINGALDDGDEFELNLDSENGEDEDSESEFEGIPNDVLIVNRDIPGLTHEERLNLDNGKLASALSSPGILLKTLHLHSGQECPECGSKSTIPNLFRRAAVGAPFTLSSVIATLLEYCPKDTDAPSEKPFGGRKMISFTDSRQGTARIAIKIQQDSERSRIRGLVYHRLMSILPQQVLSDEELMDIDELERLSSEGRISARDSRYLDQLQKKQSEASKVEVSWSEMASFLTSVPDVRFGMQAYYRRLAPKLFTAELGPRELASMFLAREFYRRPRKQNNLETMGFVQLTYPKLNIIKQAPPGWPADSESWKSYLKILMDFYIRENSFVELDRGWQRLMGAKISPKWLLSPTADDKNTAKTKRWVQTNPDRELQSRPIMLLMKAFNWTLDTQRDLIDQILRSAWKDLVDTSRLITKYGNGYQLSLTDISFTLPRKLELCPVTRRFLDTTFFGFSPYAPRWSRTELKKVEFVKFPKPSISPLDDYESHLILARRWLEEDADVLTLREAGLWSDLHDRVVEGGAYFRAAEHSAQQPKERLVEYEKSFREGYLNLLSCSTTMEMGVDIGGITVIAMNNVPPHPANYLQRAGRAGRRREGRSIALTVCKNTPHDQAVFANPSWPFTTAMKVPLVSLRSPDLVYRHINSFLLSYWMNKVIGRGELKKMTAGSFFVGEGDASLSLRFGNWCKLLAEQEPIEVKEALSELLKATSIQNTQHRAIYDHVYDFITQIHEEWSREFESVNNQLAVFLGATEKKSAALRALNAQIKRVRDEYLLGELANRKFLPGYGFPTDVVGFDTRSIYTMRDEEGASREDNRGRFRQLASRDRATALREYAPGAEVVLDGLVYRSGGITLNWHMPASESRFSEVQLFKYAWRCAECGSSGSHITTQPLDCEECGEPLEQSNIKRYLVPSGFAVNFLSDEPHTDISSPKFVPVKRPWLSVRGQNWLSLANPVLGQFRTSSRAHLFHHTAGSADNGFAICLECGRSEAMHGIPDDSALANEQFLPKVFRSGQSHTRLRGGKDDSGLDTCPGSINAWKIQSYVCLGQDTITDAIELMLRDPVSGEWVTDDIAAYSISVALRSAIAQILGIQEEELGCDSKIILHNGHVVRLIQIFDQRSGGYSTQVSAHINTRALWGKVFDVLNCTCRSACQKCLLSFDTRFEASRLDRHSALAVIDKEWVDQLALQDDEHLFGQSTFAETIPLLEAVERDLASGHFSAIQIFLQGKCCDWDFPTANRLRNRLLSWHSRGLYVELLAQTGTTSTLDETNRHRLASLIDNGIIFREIPLESVKASINHYRLISLIEDGRAQIWASKAFTPGLPDQHWADAVPGYVIVRGQSTQTHTEGDLISAEIMRPASSVSVAEVDIQHELNGSVASFGERFWSLLCQHSPSLAAKLASADCLVSASYSDRYLRNPLAVALLIEVVHRLATRLGQNSNEIEFKVYSQPFNSDFYKPLKLWHDWANDTLRDEVMAEALEYCGFNSSVCSLKDIEHGRSLRLQFSSGESIRIRLDQGFSYWKVDSTAERGAGRFNFAMPSGEQAKVLTEVLAQVTGSKDGNTQVFIKLE